MNDETKKVTRPLTCCMCGCAPCESPSSCRRQAEYEEYGPKYGYSDRDPDIEESLKGWQG